jgi:hypothetical protein
MGLRERIDRVARLVEPDDAVQMEWERTLRHLNNVGPGLLEDFEPMGEVEIRAEARRMASMGISLSDWLVSRLTAGDTDDGHAA